MDPTLFFQKCKQQYRDELNEVKTPWVLVGASNSGHSMIAYLLRQLTKSNILWFVLDLWPLKILAPTWTQLYFFQKCKQQYWDKLNEVKTPWVLVGAASSKHIKSAYRTAWIFICPLIYCALTLRKCLENYKKYWTNRTQTFFYLFYWSNGSCTTSRLFRSFSTLAHKVNEAWKWHKIEKFDLWPQFTSCANEGPSSLHLHLLLSS